MWRTSLPFIPTSTHSSYPAVCSNWHRKGTSPLYASRCQNALRRPVLAASPVSQTFARDYGVLEMPTTGGGLEPTLTVVLGDHTGARAGRRGTPITSKPPGYCPKQCAKNSWYARFSLNVIGMESQVTRTVKLAVSIDVRSLEKIIRTRGSEQDARLVLCAAFSGQIARFISRPSKSPRLGNRRHVFWRHFLAGDLLMSLPMLRAIYVSPLNSRLH